MDFSRAVRHIVRPRGRPIQGPPRRISDRHYRSRSAGDLRRVFIADQPRDLRHTAAVRLPQAPVRARAFSGRSVARHHRRREDADVQAEEGTVFHARSGIQRQAARARGRRFCVRVEADDRSAARLAMEPPAARQDRRRRSGRRPRQGDRQVRLRRQDRRPAVTRSLHTATKARAAGLPADRGDYDSADGCGRTRGRREIWRSGHAPRDGPSGRHQRIHAARMEARQQGRARGESRLSRRCLPLQLRARRSAERCRQQG